MIEITDPRYDSKPTQPKDPGTMSRNEEDELFDATLERCDIADRVWDMIKEEITPDQHREIVRYMFRRGGNYMSDRSESARILYNAHWKRVEEIVEGEEHNTDMGKD